MLIDFQDFQRYELQCYCCGKIIGHMSGPFGGGDDNKVITGTYNGLISEYMPVCCLSCEETRLATMKRYKYNALDHYYMNIIP